MKGLFDLIDQAQSYSAFGMEMGSFDEKNERHKWIWDESEWLGAEMDAIRAKFFTEEEIKKAKMENMKKVTQIHPRRLRGGRPRKPKK